MRTDSKEAFYAQEAEMLIETLELYAVTCGKEAGHSQAAILKALLTEAPDAALLEDMESVEAGPKWTECIRYFKQVLEASPQIFAATKALAVFKTRKVLNAKDTP